MTDVTPFAQLLAGHAGLVEANAHDRWVRAQRQFDEGSYLEAAALLSSLVDDPQADEFGHALIDVRLLLARALFHSSQHARALEIADALLEDEPGEAFAHFIAGRSLHMLNRPAEATRHLKLAKALGGYGA